MDKTAPTNVIVAVVVGELGDNGWYVTDVTIRTTGDDAMSGVTCTADQFLVSDTGLAGQPFTGSCTNGAGLLTPAMPNPLTVKLDESAPTATLEIISGTLGNNDWYRSAVTVHTDGTDVGASGLESCTPDQLFTGDSDEFDVDGSCTDMAGNVGHAAPIALKIDQTVPVTTVTATGTPGANGWFITTPVTVATMALMRSAASTPVRRIRCSRQTATTGFRPSPAPAPTRPGTPRATRSR